MSYPVPVIADSNEKAVTNAETDFDTALDAGNGMKLYEFISNTACWIKQGKALLLTVATKANTVDGETFTVTLDGVDTVYEFDKTGNGVRAGHTLVDISGGGVVTAAQVAAVVVTAMGTAQPSLTLTDNSNGTITIVAAGKRLAITDTVAHASFTNANSAALAATAGSGSKFCGASERVYLDGKYGQTVSVIRDAADGKATLTPLRFLR